MSCLLILLTTYLFGIYIENFSTYNQLYGSIGAFLIFLFYIWLNSSVLLSWFRTECNIESAEKQWVMILMIITKVVFLKMQYFIDVLLTLSLGKPYTYAVTSGEYEFLKPGFRVAVSFGKSKSILQLF